MNTTLLIVVAAIVVAIVLFLLLRKKKPEIEEKRPEKLELPAEEKAAAEEARAEPAEERVPSEVPPPEAPAAPPTAEPALAPEVIPEEAPGVSLDEQAEAEAAARLEEARRERKLKKLRKGLAPTRGGLIAKIGALFKAKQEIDPSLLEELEEALITSDVGMATTQMLVEVLQNALDRNELSDPNAAWDLLKEEIRHVLRVDAPPIDVSVDKPYVILVVGVNGVGKTTTIGKLATQYIADGHKVVLAAGDTFRAAAVNQLEIWGKRAGAEVIKSKEGADPSSVVFEAVKQAKEKGADIVIADTAGRLHTKIPLMEELKKIGRVTGKAHDGAPHQVLIVLDATTGQNAIAQVSMFKEALDLTGIVVTKLDGTAKGGVIIGICHEHKLPIRFIGIGEAKDDLREFELDDFVEALFLKEEDTN